MQSHDGNRSREIGRRFFLEGVTIGAGALVLGCNSPTSGPGGEDGAAPIGSDGSLRRDASVGGDGATGNRAPVWVAVPTISFVQGIPSSFSVAGLVSDADGDELAIMLNEVPLPAGVSYDAETRRFVYDGSGPVATTSGHVLSADDGRAG